VIKVIYVGSHSNSRRGSSVEFASLRYINSKTFKVRRVGNRTLIGQDPGIINERARLYTYISLILVLKGAGLSDFPLIYPKKVL
jgi:hypothetical protein